MPNSTSNQKHRTDRSDASSRRSAAPIEPCMREQARAVGVEARPGHPTAGITPDQRALYERAIALYGVRCLWNCRPSTTPQGLRIVARRLRLHGDMGAWRLACQIEESLIDAARRVSEDHLKDPKHPALT